MKLEFHPEAEMEFIEAAVYYELQVLDLGVRFGAEVRRAADLLMEHPEIGARIDPELRQLIVGRFPFTLIYSVQPDVLQIVAVAHQRRQPGYWRSRVNR